MEALASVRGNLCAAQFPHDERFIDERRDFASRWPHQARAAIAGGSHPADLVAAALALDLDPADLRPAG